MDYGTPHWFDGQYGRGSGDPWGLDWRPSQRLRFDAMLRALQEAPSDVPERPRVLDFGCATGSFTVRLAEWVASRQGELLAVDASARAVELARARAPAVRFEAWTLDECRSRSCAFDLVTCLEVLYYVPTEDRAAFIDDLSRLLSPGGLMLVSSMLGRPPYFTEAGLREQVARSLDVLEMQTLYLRPLAALEKLLMGVARRTTGGTRPPEPVIRAFVRMFDPKRAALAARLGRALLRSRAGSHVYVFGRKR